MEQPPRDEIDRLAAEAIEAGDATGWFDEVYKAADSDASRIPWADEKPNRSALPMVLRERHWRVAHPQWITQPTGAGR